MVFAVSVYCECLLWVFAVGVCCEYLRWVFAVGVCCTDKRTGERAVGQTDERTNGQVDTRTGGRRTTLLSRYSPVHGVHRFIRLCSFLRLPPSLATLLMSSI